MRGPNLLKAPTGDLKYRVIPKSEIPAQERKQRHYGEWRAIVRLMKTLDPTEAVELQLTRETYASKAFSCLQNAAREEGIKLSSSLIDGKLYIVKVGEWAEGPRWGVAKHAGKCRICGDEYKTTRRWQIVCGKVECDKERRRQIRRAYKKRKREAKKAVDRLAA